MAGGGEPFPKLDSSMKRETAIDRLKDSPDPFDLLVVGGGATGLGTAVDAASRGHRVLLMEQGDFAMGTSSHSTKLVHGGVRYLKQGNVSLVLESLRERGLLFQNAPHLVHNRAFVIPAYTWWEKPFYGVGMKLYDRLAGKRGLSPSKMLSRDEVLKATSTVEMENLRGGVMYYDGQFDDSRLALNLAQTAVEHGACVVNYVKCVGFIKEKQRVVGVLARDQESGEEFEISARAVVNATGVFVDELRRQADSAAKGIITVSQGIHVVLPKSFLPGEAALMIPKTNDGRVLFCVPWHDRVVVGTTDTPLKEPSLKPRALPEERDFLMEHAAKYLSKDPTPDDVLSIFAGLRPLVTSGGAQNTSKISREHTILVSPSGLISVTGGKWTTYRKMAEEVVDRAEKTAGLEKQNCVTEYLKIHGWTLDSLPESHLSVYGSDVSAIREIEQQNPELGERLHPHFPYRKSEVIWQVREEMARTVEDVLARRTRSLPLDAAASSEAADTTARLMAPVLGKGEDWIQSQINAYHSFAPGYMFNARESSAQ